MTCDQFWRARLRAEFVSRLTSATAAGSKVFPSRSLPWNIWQPENLGELPALAVYVEASRFDGATSGGFSGSADVVVECWVTGATEAASDTALDALSAEVYRAILETSLSRCTVDSFGDEPLSISDGAILLSASRITFSVVFDLCIEPDVELDDFETALIEVDQQTPDGTVDIAVTALPEQPPEEP